MQPLSHGDTIGVVSPASAPDDAVYREAAAFLGTRGYKARFFGVGGEKFGRMSATDDARAHAINEAFRDPEVKAIICSRGGYGSGRLVDKIDFECIARNPKPFVGYSDITHLLMSIYRQTGMTAFHGPMMSEIVSTCDAGSIDGLFSIISGRSNGYSLQPSDFSLLRPGQARGRIIGGNISILCAMAGTTEIMETEDTIVVLEDVGEFMYSLDRSLVQLSRAGLFAQAKAILIADMRLKDRGPDNSLGFSLEEVLSDHFSQLNVPIVFDLPIGHTDRQLTLPIGEFCTVDLRETSFRIDFPEMFNSTPNRFAAE